jgi:GT2 family glycosyltransferase
VDDGSAAGVDVARVAAGFGARVIRLGRGGPSAARNAGAAQAACEVVLLLDDDCLPQPGWARALVAAVAQDRIVGGAVVPPRGASVWLRASERIAAEAEAGGDFFRTLNLACLRELILRIPFDAAFPAAAGEDRDWCARATRAGVRLVREPAAVVEHRAALDARSFVGRQLRYGAAVHLLRRRGTHVPVAPGVLWRGLAAGLGDDPAAGTAMAAALALTGVGYVGEALRR